MTMHVIDNFFTDPYSVRNIALRSKYRRAKDYRWPGYRSGMPLSMRSAYQNKINSVLNQQLKIQAAYFQYIDKSWGSGVPHGDEPCKYTCITFLNLDPPFNSGVEVYDETSPIDSTNDKFIRQYTSTRLNFYSSERNPIEQFFFEKKIKSLKTKFKNPCIISNKFNRTVIFDSPLIHRAQNFFGNTVTDSRLILISFVV